VAKHRFELGGLANDAEHRFDGAPFQGFEQGPHAEAADFFIV
jgi:hypothetical protein